MERNDECEAKGPTAHRGQSPPAPQACSLAGCKRRRSSGTSPRKLQSCGHAESGGRPARGACVPHPTLCQDPWMWQRVSESQGPGHEGPDAPSVALLDSPCPPQGGGAQITEWQQVACGGEGGPVTASTKVPVQTPGARVTQVRPEEKPPSGAHPRLLAHRLLRHNEFLGHRAWGQPALWQ